MCSDLYIIDRFKGLHMQHHYVSVILLFYFIQR